MHPLVNNTCKTSHEDNFDHAAKAALPPVQRSRTKPEHARLSAATAAVSDSKRPTHKSRQVSIAVAAAFSACVGERIELIDWQLLSARLGLRRLHQRCVDVGPHETDGRRDFHLNGAVSP
jgi:hypothetical protein